MCFAVASFYRGGLHERLRYMYIVSAIHVTLLLFRLSLGQEFRVEGSFRTALSEGVLLFNGGDRPQDLFFQS